MTAAPTSTTNITGFFIRVAGFSLTNDCFVARPRISGSKRGRDRASLLGISEPGSAAGAVGFSNVGVTILAPELSGIHQEVLDDGSQRERREIG